MVAGTFTQPCTGSTSVPPKRPVQFLTTDTCEPNFTWEHIFLDFFLKKDHGKNASETRVRQNPVTGVLTQRLTGKVHVKTEAETGMTLSQAKGCLEPPGAGGSKKAILLLPS